MIKAEAAKRRTFAIISHPDAGKTTLTEKLLLYSGMVRTAGMVRGRKTGKKASSDWMGMEQERGISITASAMQFEYNDALINVLDTPGHQDFSEDTYRTLTAADSAIMVLDAAKGVEMQTRKLFEVCALRKIPVLTFINKLDMPGLDPFDLLAEVEEVLGIEAAARNWPIGSGKEFQGVADCATKEVYVFEKTSVGGAKIADCKILPLEEAKTKIPEKLAEQLDYELSLVNEAGNTYSQEKFLAGKQTQVFFGSALTNFGLEPFFNSFVQTAPSPMPRRAFSTKENEELFVDLEEPFSGYVFKIQSNMDPKHRDSMAFLRVCSGKFSRDQSIKHERLNKEIRLSRTHRMVAGERETIEEAYPGDIVGVINPGIFSIGDTVSEKGGFSYEELPQFCPEVVAKIRPKTAMKRKQFDKGLNDLSQEGAIQVLIPLDSTEALVAAVGRLQFEVLQYRLKQDYNVDTELNEMSYTTGAWISGDHTKFKSHSRSLIAKDLKGRIAVLFRSEHEKQYTIDQNPDLNFLNFSR